MNEAKEIKEKILNLQRERVRGERQKITCKSLLEDSPRYGMI